MDERSVARRVVVFLKIAFFFSMEVLNLARMHTRTNLPCQCFLTSLLVRVQANKTRQIQSCVNYVIIQKAKLKKKLLSFLAKYLLLFKTRKLHILRDKER